MKLEFSTQLSELISTDVLLVLAIQGDSPKKSFIPLSGFTAVDAYLDGKLTAVCDNEQFSGKRKEMITVYPQKKMLATKIVVMGLGNRTEFVADDLRRSMGYFAKKYLYAIDSVALVIPDGEQLGMDATLAAHVLTEGLLLGSYEFAKYKHQEKKDHVLSTLIVISTDKKEQKKISAAFAQAKLFADATRVARDMVNEQPYIATPTYLAKFAKDLAKSNPLVTCNIYNKDQIEKMGMEAFLGIARAANTPPQFIHLTYTPKKKSKRKLAIIGKGITFDSGGINVKPGDHMKDMKMDMAGAAAVLGIFSVISAVQPDFTVMGIIAATPNLVASHSIVPGDVVRAMNGKTIEILNTDAEGRVTMADSLSFAVKEGATEIIDFATLTGACIAALGEDIAGLFPNNQDLVREIKAAAFDAGEKVWEMPMDKDYREYNKSDVADLANIPSMRYAGAITAGLFLEEFVDNTPFVHIDIAGPAFTNKGSDLSVKGGTGFGVRTILQLLTKGEKI